MEIPSPAIRESRACSKDAADVSASAVALPDVLAGSLVDRRFERLRREWRPATPSEEFHVRELARHDAALERTEQIEAAILRRGSRGTSMTPVDLESSSAAADAALAGAGITDALDRISKYRRTHERGFHKSYAILSALKSAATQEAPKQITPPQEAFGTEAVCEEFLMARVRKCEGCGGVASQWIPSRKTHVCQECRWQSGLRIGTVMERSALPLSVWFRAIEALLAEPTLSTTALSVVTGIRRDGTNRSIAKRIREAIAQPDASTRLAGLDQYFGQPQSVSRSSPK